MALQEIGRQRTPRAPQPPEVDVTPGALLVATRCPDFGDVDLEVWAGDPGGLPVGWELAFAGDLETQARGFDAGTATASVFHLNAQPGTHSVRVEVRRDEEKRIDGVRFIFPKTIDLDGRVLG